MPMKARWSRWCSPTSCPRSRRAPPTSARSVPCRPIAPRLSTQTGRKAPLLGHRQPPELLVYRRSLIGLSGAWTRRTGWTARRLRLLRWYLGRERRRGPHTSSVGGPSGTPAGRRGHPVRGRWYASAARVLGWRGDRCHEFAGTSGALGGTRSARRQSRSLTSSTPRPLRAWRRRSSISSGRPAP